MGIYHSHEVENNEISSEVIKNIIPTSEDSIRLILQYLEKDMFTIWELIHTQSMKELSQQIRNNNKILSSPPTNAPPWILEQIQLCLPLLKNKLVEYEQIQQEITVNPTSEENIILMERAIKNFNK